MKTCARFSSAYKGMSTAVDLFCVYSAIKRCVFLTVGDIDVGEQGGEVCTRLLGVEYGTWSEVYD